MAANETNDIFCGSFHDWLNCAVKRYELVHASIRRIHHEMEILRLMSVHANVVEFYFHTENVDHGYLGMQKADNGDLFTQIAMRKTLPLDYARRYVNDIIKGLQHIHHE